MRRFLLILDGAAEAPLPCLGGRTPLDYAHTPGLDRLPFRGLLQTCPEGLPPGSDTAMLNIFGADPKRCFRGRGALEAAGLGIDLGPGETAVRGNLVKLSPEGKLLLAHGAQGEKALAAAKALEGDSRFRALLENAGGRMYAQAASVQMLVFPGPLGALAAPHEHLGEPAEALLPENVILLALHRRSREVLAESGLALWFWGAGERTELAPFPAPGVLISATPVCRGIGRLLGLSVPKVPGATGDADTDYGAKARAVISAFSSGAEFVAAHVEAPDTLSHKRDVFGKIHAIEAADSLLLSPVLDFLQEGGPSRVLVLSDHETSSVTGLHTASPVPFWFWDSDGRFLHGSPMEMLFAK